MSFRILLICFTAFSILACYARKEACLDLLSANYDVTADDDCVSCCIYPTLKLTISHMAGDSIFRTSAIYSNNFNQNYIIEDIRYYVSDFNVFQGNTNYKIREKIETENNVISVANDMKILRAADKTLDIGTIRASGLFDSLQLKVGLTNDMTKNTFVNLPSSHVLLKNNMLKDTAGTIAHFAMRYKKVSSNDSIPKTIILTSLPTLPVISVDKSTTTKKGETINFAIKAEYLRLLKNVDLNLPEAQIIMKVKENIVEMLTVK